MMLPEGKTTTAPTAIRFCILDACSPAVFSGRFLVNCVVNAYFTTFLFRFLCDGGREH